MISKQAISSKFALAGLVLLVLFLGRLKYKQWQNDQEIIKQKNTLLAQADAQQKKNDELNQSLQYLNSPEFKERVARDQLGLKKQGEIVYGFTENQTPTPVSQQPVGKYDNLKKWWDYFFAEN